MDIELSERERSIYRKLGYLEQMGTARAPRTEFYLIKTAINDCRVPSEISESLIARVNNLFEEYWGPGASIDALALTKTGFGADLQLIDKSYAPQLLSEFPTAEFYRYLNKTMHAKPVLFMKLAYQKYILKEVSPDFELKYNPLKDAEHRPEAFFRKINGNTLGFFEFISDEPVDRTNLSHLEQLIDIGLNFTRRKESYDNNPSNFVNREGRIYFIDSEIGLQSNQKQNLILMGNLLNVIGIIPVYTPFRFNHIELVYDTVNYLITRLPEQLSGEELTALAIDSNCSSIEDMLNKFSGALKDVDNIGKALCCFS